MADTQSNGDSVAVPTQATKPEKMKLSEFKEYAHCMIFATKPTIKEACDYAKAILGDNMETHTAIGVLLNTLTEVLEND